MLPTMRPSQPENKRLKSQSPLNRHVSASSLDPFAFLSSGVVAEGSNARSRYTDSQVEEIKESMAWSVYSESRDSTQLAPVRAAYNNRRNCDTITSNYEEAFGPVDFTFQRASPNPRNGPGSSASIARPESSSHTYNHLSDQSLTPINCPPVSSRCATNAESPTNLRSSKLQGKRTRDNLVSAKLESPDIRPTTLSGDAPQQGSKRKFTATHSTTRFDASLALRARTSETPSPILLSAQPTMKRSINLS